MIKIKQTLNSTARLIFILCFFSLLSGCTPKFEIENYHNNLRDTDVCQMQNNIVKKINISKRCRPILCFDLWKKTEYEFPYGLTITISGTNSPSLFSDSPKGLDIMKRVFKNDSRAQINMTKNGQMETLKIVSLCANHDAHQEVSSYGGSVSVINYAVSCVHFSLSEEQILKIVSADDLSFEIETVVQQNIMGTLSPENMINIKQFAAQCFAN